MIDPFPHAYTLEISSPGLDRPLRKIQDYRRVVGHPVNIKLREPLNGQWRLEGTLAAVEDDAVTLTIQQKKTTETVRVAFDHIALARRSVEF